MRLRRLPLLLLLTLASCTAGAGAGPSDAGPSDAGAGAAPCAILFGTPNDATGLGPDQCRRSARAARTPSSPPTYGAAFIQSLVDDWQLATPYPPLTSTRTTSGAPRRRSRRTRSAPCSRRRTPARRRAVHAGDLRLAGRRRGGRRQGHALRALRRVLDAGEPGRLHARTTTSSRRCAPAASRPRRRRQRRRELPACSSASICRAPRPGRTTPRTRAASCLATVPRERHREPYNQPDGALNPCIAVRRGRERPGLQGRRRADAPQLRASRTPSAARAARCSRSSTRTDACKMSRRHRRHRVALDLCRGLRCRGERAAPGGAPERRLA